MSKANPLPSTRELNQLPPKKLVEIIVAQQIQINQLQQEAKRLKGSLNLESQTSSKPPSTDLLKKSKNAKNQQTETQNPFGEKPPRRVNTTPGRKAFKREWLRQFPTGSPQPHQAKQIELMIDRAIDAHERKVGIVSGIIGVVLLSCNFIWLWYLTKAVR